ncbi:MAG: NAD(P)/FAD-dependent oxidoreductase [Halioglobus sp.]|nr:NAD(P)/FAD-dependent oxidoreductase [Halioglobus sp.]
MKIAVIGAGPAGIAAGYELLKSGFDNFTIFDKLDAPGGTWRQHSYPGLACDVWAHSYTFSYAPNPDWSASFVGYTEIQQYLARCCTGFGLDPHLALNTAITRAQFGSDGKWTLESEQGSLGQFDIVINAMGNQHTPLYPDVPGREAFQGASWHSTEWNHNTDLTGKRVVVVGSAAAAVQIVPEIAREAGHLTVLQRSANWIMPRNQKRYGKGHRWRFNNIPGWIALTRWVQRMMMGQVFYAVTIGHNRMGQFENMVKKFIRRSIDDPALRDALIPNTSYGCKRGLVSDDFYPALNRDNVELVAEGLQRVTTTGVVTTSGREIETDVIIFCTGYKILDYDRFDVIGKDGRHLGEELAGDPRSHKGIAAPGFPNYFFAMGPNGLVLNVSYFITAECNVATIVRLLSSMRARGASALEVKQRAFNEYNAWMDERFERFSWGARNCHSYYTAGSSHPPFLFPGTFREYSRLHQASGLHEYDLSTVA